LLQPYPGPCGAIQVQASTMPRRRRRGRKQGIPILTGLPCWNMARFSVCPSGPPPPRTSRTPLRTSKRRRGCLTLPLIILANLAHTPRHCWPTPLFLFRRPSSPSTDAKRERKRRKKRRGRPATPDRRGKHAGEIGIGTRSTQLDDPSNPAGAFAAALACRAAGCRSQSALPCQPCLDAARDERNHCLVR
jgi:hypothetical protein